MGRAHQASHGADCPPGGQAGGKENVADVVMGHRHAVSLRGVALPAGVPRAPWSRKCERPQMTPPRGPVGGTAAASPHRWAHGCDFSCDLTPAGGSDSSLCLHPGVSSDKELKNNLIVAKRSQRQQTLWRFHLF